MTETQSLIRAIAILDCFCPETPELGVRDIARRLHLPAATVGRLLLTYRAAGILQQDPATRLYRMGPHVLQWSSVYVGRLDLAKESRPVLEEFARITRETVSVYVLDGTTRVCLDRIESPERVRVVVRPGERMPLHAGSAGKAILAFMLPQMIKQILAKPLERMTVHTITNHRKLLQDLELIRARGYATSHCERFDDALGLGAPIFNASGEVIAALNVAGPIMRFTDTEVEKFAPKIIQLANQISLALGYTGALAHLRSGVKDG